MSIKWQDSYSQIYIATHLHIYVFKKENVCLYSLLVEVSRNDFEALCHPKLMKTVPENLRKIIVVVKSRKNYGVLARTYTDTPTEKEGQRPICLWDE